MVQKFRGNREWMLVDRVSFWHDENILKIDCGENCTVNILTTKHTL